MKECIGISMFEGVTQNAPSRGSELDHKRIDSMISIKTQLDKPVYLQVQIVRSFFTQS